MSVSYLIRLNINLIRLAFISKPCYKKADSLNKIDFIGLIFGCQASKFTQLTKSHVTSHSVDFFHAGPLYFLLGTIKYAGAQQPVFIGDGREGELRRSRVVSMSKLRKFGKNKEGA